MKKRYNAIDLTKLIMSLLIVGNHTWPSFGCESGLAYGFYYSVMDLSLPFFFLATGFFMADSFEGEFTSEHNRSVVKEVFNKFLSLYLVWTLIYLPITVSYYSASGNTGIHSLLSFFKNFVLWGEQYNSWQLWFLLSSVYALFAVEYCLRKKLGMKGISYIGIIGFLGLVIFDYVVSLKGSSILVVSSTAGITEKMIGNGRIFMGLLYIPAGIYLYKMPVKRSTAAFAFVFGLVVDAVLFSADEFAGKVVLIDILNGMKGIGLFELVRGISLPDSRFYFYARKLSAVNYYIHMWVWTVYYMMTYGKKHFSADCFMATAIVTTLIGVVYIELRYNKKAREEQPAFVSGPYIRTLR